MSGPVVPVEPAAIGGPPGSGDSAARLFVAVVPPPGVLDRLASDLPRPPRSGVRYTRPDQWHVTLRFLGRASVAAAVDALEGLVAAPVGEVRLGPGTVRLGRSVVCLPAGGLEPLAAAVSRATATVGRPPERRPFAGHLTVARLAERRGTPRARAPSGPAGPPAGPAGAPAGGLVGVPFEAVFGVGEVHLMRSRTLPGGAVYDVVVTRRLEGDDPARAGRGEAP